MGRIIEGLWDCPYCGQKGIGGLTKHCPNCSHPQDAGTRFYLGEKKNYLDEKKAANYGKGEDWTCAYCGSLNRYNVDVCANCGAPRAESTGNYSDNVKKNPEGDSEIDSQGSFTLSEEKRRQIKAQGDALRQQKAAQKKASNKKRFTFLGVALAVIAVILLAVFWPRHAEAVLDSKSWSREIQVEKYKTVHENDWNVPDGGRVTDTKEEIHHYDQVVDHYETVRVQKSREVQDGYDTYTITTNNGDGTFTEEQVSEPRYKTEYYYDYEEQPVYKDVPVYYTKYYYDIERWVYERSVCTDGTEDAPYWGEVTLGENEREGERYDEYYMIFATAKGDTYGTYVPEELFDSLSVGDTVTLTLSNSVIKKINDTKV